MPGDAQSIEAFVFPVRLIPDHIVAVRQGVADFFDSLGHWRKCWHRADVVRCSSGSRNIDSSVTTSQSGHKRHRLTEMSASASAEPNPSRQAYVHRPTFLF